MLFAEHQDLVGHRPGYFHTGSMEVFCLLSRKSSYKYFLRVEMASSRYVSFSLCAIFPQCKPFWHRSMLFQGIFELIVCHQTFTKLHIIGNIQGDTTLYNSSGSILGAKNANTSFSWQMMQQEPQVACLNLCSWLWSPWKKESVKHLTSLLQHMVLEAHGESWQQARAAIPVILVP